MQHLTIIRKKNGILGPREVDQLQSRVVQHGPYPDGMTASTRHLSQDGRSLAVWATNESPQPQYWSGPSCLKFALGYPLPAADAMASFSEGPDLHRQIGLMVGRFSAATFDLASGRANCAVPLARQDAFYHGHSSDYSCIGNWSSSVAAALNPGSLQHEDEKLFGFLNSGHFIGSETFYRGVEALPAYSTATLDDDGIRVHCDLFDLFRQSLESKADERIFRDIAEALVMACRSADGLDPELRLNLSGGKDSRLLLAAFNAAGFTIHGQTYSGGASNSSDVYVASLVAQAAGIKHVVRPYAKSPAADEEFATVDFYARTHALLRASDSSVVAWVNQTYSPAFHHKVTLNGLGGELMRGGHASKADQAALARRPADSTLKKRWGKFSPRFRADLQEQFSARIDSWLAEFSPHQLGPLEVADFAYVDAKLGRWGSAISRPGDISHKSFYPFLDNRLTTLIYQLPPSLRVGDVLIHHLTTVLDPRLVDVPIAYDDWKCQSQESSLRMRSLHPQAYVPRGTGTGKNTDWRVNWLQLLPEFKRQYMESTDAVLREMVDEGHVLGLLDGAATNNDRYLLFSLYAASIVRNGGLERPPENHPMNVTL